MGNNKRFAVQEFLAGKNNDIRCRVEKADMDALKQHILEKRLNPEIWNTALKILDEKDIYQVHIQDSHDGGFSGIIGYAGMKYDPGSTKATWLHPTVLADSGYNEPWNALVAALLKCHPGCLFVKGICPVYDYHRWKHTGARFVLTMGQKNNLSKGNKKWMLRNKNTLLDFELDPAATGLI